MKQMRDSIIRIFQNSKKRHLFITGSKNSGKTTLYQQLYLMLLEKPCGITSYLQEDSVVLKEDCTNRTTIVGKRINGWMQCVEEGFLYVGIQALERMIASECNWTGIDEIGFLETEVEAYQNKIRELLDKKRVLCCIRKQELQFLEELKQREDVFLWDMDMHKIGCVLMASGLSTRFGKNKLLMEYEGKTFIEHALYVSSSFPFLKRKVYTRTKALERIVEAYNVEIKVHDFPCRNEAIALAMKDMQEMDACIFMPCDQPLLSSISVEKLIETAFKTKKGIVRLSFENEVGAPILFKQKYFSMLKELPLKKGGSYIAKMFEEDVEYVKVEDKNELFDVDTYEDYCELLKIKSEV